MHAPTITSEQKASFDRDGFLILRANEHNLTNSSQLQAWTDEILGWPLEHGKWMPYDEVNVNGDRQIMRTEKIIDYHPPLKELLDGEAVLSILKQVTGNDAVLFKDKINYKLPAGSGFAAHIDAPSYEHMGKMEFMEVMLAVEAHTVQNGCLEVVPGSNRREVALAFGGRLQQAWETSNAFIPVLLEPGDMLLFGSKLAHRSGPNKTNGRRAAVFGTYHFQTDQPQLREEYYKHRRANFPPDHERKQGEEYQEGYKMFAFSSPFAKTEPTTVKA